MTVGIKYVFLMGLAGGFGVLCRYGIGLIIASTLSSSFPWATVAANLLGSLLLGGVLACQQSLMLSHHISGLVVIGFLGGLTTFSAFSGELLVFLQQRQFIKVMGYFLILPAMGLFFCALGYYLVHGFELLWGAKSSQ